MASISKFEKALSFLYISGGFCTGMAILYSNTYGLERYKSILAIQSPDGREEKVDVEILKMSEEIKQARPKRRFGGSELIYVFPSSFVEFCRVGNLNTKWGSHIGIPKYYMQKYSTDEEHLNALFQSMNIDPDSDAAQNIRQSFNISDDAKRFAIAREVKLSENYQFFFFSLGAQAVGVSFYWISNFLSSIASFTAVRVWTFVPFSLFWYCLFSGFFEISSRFSLKGADKAAASISPEIAQAGLEYYNAMIARQEELNRFKGEKTGKEITFSLKDLAYSSWLDSCMTLKERKNNLMELIRSLYGPLDTTTEVWDGKS